MRPSVQPLQLLLIYLNKSIHLETQLPSICFLTPSSCCVIFRTSRCDQRILKQGGAFMKAPYRLPLIESCAICKARPDGFFCSLPRPLMTILDGIKQPIAYRARACVFLEGQKARGIFVVCQGRVKLSTISTRRRTTILKIAAPGEILGLPEMVKAIPYDTTAENLEPCQLGFISREAFAQFLLEEPGMCFRLARYLSRDCQTAYRLIRSLGFSRSAPQKLAHIFLQWAAQGQPMKGEIRVNVPLTHEEIAECIGASRETVTRTAAEFRRKHLAELRGPTLVVNNPTALEKLQTS